jgi:hypothetical protein
VSLREDVYRRAGGRCECRMKTCSHHSGRCNAVLRGEWEVHRIIAGGPYILSNVAAMCQRCHRNTPSVPPPVFWTRNRAYQAASCNARYSRRTWAGER